MDLSQAVRIRITNLIEERNINWRKKYKCFKT